MPASGVYPHTNRTSGVIMFRTRTHTTFLAILTLALALPMLAACHTTAGAGQDISDTGHVINKAATNATP